MNYNDFLCKMRGVDRHHVLEENLTCNDIVIICSTTSTGCLGFPITTVETPFTGEDGKDLFTTNIKKCVEVYDICLYSELNSTQDHCFHASANLACILNNLNHYGFFTLELIVSGFMVNFPQCLDLSFYEEVINPSCYKVSKMVFYNLFLYNFYFYYNNCNFIFLFFVPTFWFFTPTSSIPVTVNCIHLNKDIRHYMCLRDFYYSIHNLDFSYFYLHNFYTSVNFFTFMNEFIIKKIKHKMLLGNRGSINFQGFRFLQYNYFSFLSKVNFLFTSNFWDAISYYCRIYMNRFSYFVFSNFSFFRCYFREGSLKNMYKKGCVSRTFKYAKMDSSYYKDNAGKKEIIPKVLCGSIKHYNLVLYNNEIEVIKSIKSKSNTKL
uniref:hypothetical protein n=1 Tax=Myxobolus wulii TaxID=649408 RepID=UPI003001DB39